MQPITEKDTEIINQWYKDASKQTIETLPDFMRHVLNDYCHDFRTIVKAIGACSIAAAWAANNNPRGGITGFQASMVTWEFIKHWNYSSNKTGMRLINYDDMLYPQFKHRFDKAIPEQLMENLTHEAKKRLDEYKSNRQSSVHPDVLAHWESIANGIAPFGYVITKE